MRLRHPLLIALTTAGYSGIACAGVVVPAINQPNVQATGTNGTVQQSKENSALIWKNAIAAPPESRISNHSKTAMERALVTAYNAGKTQDLPPIAGTNGEVLYAYGQSLPTLVTAPLHTSLLVLQSGLKAPTEVGLSPAYWNLKTLTAGDQPELAITPRYAGLHGNLVITGTSAGGKPMNYIIEVTSDATKYTPEIGFYYPGQMVRTWQNNSMEMTTKSAAVQHETVATLPNINAADLNFNWKMECGGGGWFSDSDCTSIEPQRVFDDGKQTFIQFASDQASHGGIPSILAENAAGKNAIINATFRDGYYIVNSVPHKILLVAGKGESGKVVKLVRDGKEAS